ncbi:MAG: HAD family phosphatase [Verrucomicrobia bacterium]|nr:HAD family phosphatase [Verrucomicrobiota bacterium]MDA1086899.1 HAD family phosphatase [Verrucomicrobiota bacterium]
MTERAPWGVIFDVDGTMVDNRDYHRRAWIEFGERHNLPITAAFYSQNIHSKSNDNTTRLLYGEDCGDDVIARVADEKESLYRDLYRPDLREMPGLTRLLADLGREHVPCATVSNSTHANIELVLSGLGIRECFDVVLSFTDVTHSKPHPEMFLTAANQMDLPIERCVVIEDSPSGFAAAEAARVAYVVISSGADPAHLHKARHAAAVHPDFTTLTAESLRVFVEEKLPAAPAES